MNASLPFLVWFLSIPILCTSTILGKGGGHGVRFMGADGGALWIEPFSGLFGSRQATFEFWIMYDEPYRAQEYMLSIASQATDNHVALSTWSNKFANFFAAASLDLPLSLSLFPSHWTHMAYTINTNTATDSSGLFRVRVYINGTLASTGTLPRANKAFNTTFPSELALVVGQEQDKYFGGIDPNQSFQGYFDEFRVWRVERTAAEIAANYNLSPVWSSPDLVAHWRLDEGSGTTAASDAAAAAATTALTLGPMSKQGSGQCGGLMPRWVKGAPLYSAARTAILSVNASGDTEVAIGGLDSDSPTASPTLTLTQLPTQGTLYLADGVTAITTVPTTVARATATDAKLLFRPSPAFAAAAATAAAPVTDALAYSVTVGAVTGSVTVTLQRNSRPVATGARVSLKEGAASTIILPTSDAEHDRSYCVITALPSLPGGGLSLFQSNTDRSRGAAITAAGTRVTNFGCAVSLQLPPSHFGLALARIGYTVVDAYTGLRSAAPGWVTLDVEMVNGRVQAAPPFASNATEDAPSPHIVELRHHDDDSPYVVASITRLPTHGTLYQVREGAGGQPVLADPILEVSVASGRLVEQWASGVRGFSSEFPVGAWRTTSMLGPPDSLNWWPTTAEKCTNLHPNSQQYYTEFGEFTFDTPVFASAFHIYEYFGGGKVTRLLLLPEAHHNSSSGSSEWVEVWRTSGITSYTPPVVNHVLQVAVCELPFRTRAVRMEFNTCGSGWNSFNAILMTGHSDTRRGVVTDPSGSGASGSGMPAGSASGASGGASGSGGSSLPPTGRNRVAYVPAANYHGSDTFSYQLSDCPHNRLRSTGEHSHALTVAPQNDPPTAQPLRLLVTAQHATTTAAADASATTPSTVVTGNVAAVAAVAAGGGALLSLSASDMDGDPLSFSLTSLPSQGTLHTTDADTGALSPPLSSPPVAVAASLPPGANLSLTYRPAAHCSRSVQTFTFAVTDAAGARAQATVTLTVRIPCAPSPSLRTTFLALSLALAACALLLALLLLVRHRSHFIITASSPVFCALIFLGCGLAYLEVALLALPPSPALCVLQPWLGHLAFALVFASLFAKTHRLAVIFSNNALRRVAITNSQLLRKVGAVVAALCLYLALWTAVAPLTAVHRSDAGLNMDWTECATAAAASTADGSSGGSGGVDTWSVLLFAAEAGMLCWGIVLCVRVRGNPTKFNESKHIALIIYNLCFLSALTLPLLYGLLSAADPDSRFAVTAAAICVAATATLALLFLPKLAIILSNAPASRYSLTSGLGTGARQVRVQPTTGGGEPGTPTTGRGRSSNGGGGGEQAALRAQNQQLLARVAALEQEVAALKRE